MRWTGTPVRRHPPHIGQHGAGDVVPARERTRRRAQDAAVGGTQHGRIGVGRASDHGAVDHVEVRFRLLQAGDAPVDRHLQRRQLLLEAIDRVVAERRHLPVLGRAEAVEHGDPCVHGEAAHAGGGHRLDEGPEILVVSPPVIVRPARVPRDSDAALDGDGNIDRPDHRPGAVGHQIGRLHEGRGRSGRRERAGSGSRC